MQMGIPFVCLCLGYWLRRGVLDADAVQDVCHLRGSSLLLLLGGLLSVLVRAALLVSVTAFGFSLLAVLRASAGRRSGMVVYSRIRAPGVIWGHSPRYSEVPV